jgi:diguanylate cyclase (GGDEF)-like protein
MTDAVTLHRILARQLRRLNLAPASSPSPAAWCKLLETLSTTYHEAEDERYTLERSIEVSSREMRGLHEVLSRQATTDYLTGLPNRRALHAHADVRMGGPEHQRQALLLLDMDRFKEVNDSLGHHVGDQLLIQVGARLGQHLRVGDLLVRLGGDEFAVLLGSADQDQAAAVAVKLCQVLAEPFTLEDIAVHSSVSIGIALFPGDMDAHTARRLDAGDATMEMCRARDKLARHHAVGQDLAGAVDIGQEVLERQHPLTHAGFDADPLGLVDDARHEVERERSFLTGERKRDALVAERPVARGTALLEVVARQGREHGVERLVGGPREIGRGEHLVPCGPRPVAIQEVPHLPVSSDAALRERFGRLTGGARFPHSW